MKTKTFGIRSGTLATTLVVYLAAMACSYSGALDTWTTNATAGATQNLNAIARGNGLFVAVGQQDTILVSTDGFTWSIADAGLTIDLLGITFGNGKFIAVGQAGALISSTNGFNWPSQVSHTSNSLNGVSYGNGLFVAAGSGGTILTSPDGSAWTSQTSGTTRTLSASAYGKGVYVVVGYGSTAPATVLTSTNGTNWIDRSTNSLGVAFYAVTFANGEFVALDVQGLIYVSSDGAHWTKTSAPTGGAYLFGLTQAEGFFMAVGGGFFSGTQTIVTSVDGFNWTLRRSIPSATRLKGVAYGDGKFIAVGDSGTILLSGPVFTLKPIALSGGVFEGAVIGEIGRPYTIQAQNNPAGTNWAGVVTITNTQETNLFFDTHTSNASVRIYRAFTQ